MPLYLSVIILIFVCANATEKGENDEFFDALETFEAHEERKIMLQNLKPDSNQVQPTKEKENEESVMEKLYQEFLEEADVSMQDMSELTPKQLAELIEKLRQEMAEFEKSLSSVPAEKPEKKEDVEVKEEFKHMSVKDKELIEKKHSLPIFQNLNPKKEVNPFKRLNKQQNAKLHVNINSNQSNTPRFMCANFINKATRLDLHQRTFKITDKLSEIFNMKNLESQKMRFYMFLDELVTVGDENPRFANFLANEILTRRKQNEFLMSPALTKILRKKIIEIKRKEIEGMAQIFCWNVDVVKEEKSKLEDQLGQSL